MRNIIHSKIYRRNSVSALLASLVFCLIFATHLEAGQAKYIYDDLGRLHQVIDEAGNVASYNYDAVGNLLSVTRSDGGLTGPSLSAVTPNSANAGQTVTVTLSGTKLSGGVLRTDNPGISISGVQTTATSLKATLAIAYTARTARTGGTALTVNTPIGSATIPFTVQPTAPSISELHPDNGPVSRLVRINGVGFNDDPAQVSVTFGGISATIINATPTAIDTQVPPGVAGTDVPVVVTVNGLTSAAKTFFPRAASGPPPVITSVTPIQGSEQGGQTVRIRGSGFSTNPEVSIGDYHVVKSTFYFICIFKGSFQTGGGLIAGGGGGVSATIPCNIGPRNFYKFLGIPVTRMTVIDDTTMDVVTPPGPIGPAHVLVSNSNGDALLTNGFTYLIGPPQQIVGVTPNMGRIDIPTNAPMKVLFTRPVDRSSVTPSSFSLIRSSDSSPVSGTFSFEANDTTVGFTPAGGLAPDTAYQLTVTQDLKSVDGIPLDGLFTGFFTTAAGADTLSPTLTATPANGAANVPYNSSITVVFSEPINPLTFNKTTVIVSNNGTEKAGFIFVGEQNSVATFVPASPFFPGTPVSVTLKGTISDFAGNPIVGSNGAGSDYQFSFTTALTQDLFPPQLLQINPKSGSTGISPTASISVTFNESLNPASVNNGTFIVSSGGGATPGTIVFSNFNTVATYLPSQPLPGLSPITVTLTTGVTDVAGNAATAPFTASFTTTSNIDNFQPSVVSTSPFSGQTGVPQNGKITLVFSERINPATVTSSSFFVNGPAGQVPGQIAVSADQTSATFTPSIPLLPNAGHSIHFGNQIKDIAGNVLFNPGSSAFTTRSGPDDTTGPSVIEIGPANGAVNFPLNGHLLIRFDEAIAGTSLNAQTIILSKGGRPVDADLTLERNGTVVRVKSANLVNLAPNTFYELTVTTGVKDVAGNPLTASFTSAFTTGTAADTTAPAQLSSNPSQGSSGVPTRAGISATFSEPINPLTASFIVTGGGINGAIPGSYTLSSDLKTVTFTPDHPLPANQTYFVSRGPMEDFAGNRVTGPTWLTIFTTDYAPGTDLNALPISATVGINPNRLYADGETTTTVVVSNISRSGVLAPNGTKVAVTVDPAYRLDSAGGAILGGTPSVSDPRFRIFTTLGGSISFTYRSANLPTLLPGQTSPAYIQVAQIDAAEETMAVIGVGGITLFKGNHVTVGPNPVNLLAAAGSRSQVSIRVFDPFGKPVPAGMRIGITTDPVYYLHSLAGDFVGGTPAADPRFTIYTTITGGILEAEYIPPVLASNQNGFGILQVVEVDDAGHVLALMGTIGVINLSGSSGQTAPQPVVLAASPVQGQSGVGVNAPVVVAFSQSLDPASVTATTFSITSGGAAISGSRVLSSGVAGPNSVVTFTPAVPFSPNAVISVLVGSAIKSASGAPLLSGQSFTFSTGLEVDTTALSVSLINPANGATGVGRNNAVTVQFSESMNAVSVTPQSFTLSAGGVSIPGRVSVTNRSGDAATPSLVALFTPDQLLSPETAYTVSLSSAITDTAGNPLTSFTSTFTTSDGIDNFHPSVIAISPYNGQTGVPQNAKVILTFSEPMNPATIGPSTFFVSGPAGVVAGEITVSADRLSATFTPSVPLLPNVGHSVTFTNQITDVAGNGLSNSTTPCCARGFTTRSGPADTSGPTVLEMSPADGATAVPLNAHLLIRFDEPITQTSANNQSIVVSSDGVAVPGAISLTQNNTLLRWTPGNLALLSENATYQVNITTSVTDLSGNPLTASFTSAFTTGAAADTTSPVQISATVGEAASNRTTISATFSEPINPLTVIPGGFVVTGGGINGTIPGSYTLSSDLKTVTFTSDHPLPGNQTYFVSRGPMEDFAGNRATGPTWLTIFTTGYAAGTDLNALPTSATVVSNTSRLYADGETTTTVIVGNINRHGLLVPNGTKIAVTVDPAYRLDSAGGAIIVGTPSVSDPRFRVFTTFGGSVTFTYRSANLPDLLPGATPSALVQIAQIDAAEEVMGIIGVGGITLFRGNNVTVSPNPVNLLAAAGSRSQVSMTVFDPFGKPVPAGMRIGMTAEPVYYLHSRGGSFTGGMPAADSRFRIYSTITGGIVEADYIPPVLASNQSGPAILQVVEVDDAGHVLALMGTIGVINLSGSTGQTAPQPVVLAASPVQGQSGVGLNAPIAVAFSQSLDPATVTATTFSITSGGVAISGSRVLSAGVGGPDSVVTFTPAAPFSPNAAISVLVGSSIKSASGAPLLSGQSFTFSTGIAADTVAPSVSLINPANGAAGVGRNNAVTVQFSESMNAVSITPQSFTLSAGGVSIPGRVSVTNRPGDAATPSLVAIFTPDQLLSPDTTYTVSLSGAITDTAGNPLPPFTSTFTTSSGIDNFHPSVIAVSPYNGQGGVPLNAEVTLAFSERINPATIGPSTFIISGPVGQVDGTYTMSADQLSVTFTPSVPLLPNVGHAITFTGQITDVVGNGLLNPTGCCARTFTTRSGPDDTTGPSVLEISPADGATAVPLNAHLLLRFDEPISAASISDQTVIVSAGGVAVAGSISLERNNSVLRWKAANLILLSPNTVYTLTATAGVKDVAGNSLTAPFTSAFTTGTASDTTPPAQISATVGETASHRTTISATFNEPINPLTVIPGGFIVTGGGISGAIPGSYTLSSDLKTVTFTSDHPLPGNQTYFVSRGPMEDFAGNRATGPTWLAIFTTGYAAGTDLTALPTSTTVVSNPNRLYADGETTTTVTISNISRSGVLVPNGTKVAVTVDPAYRLDSAGGSILGGVPSVSDPRFRIFTTLNGSITLTYRSALIPDLLPGRTAPAYIQVAQVDAAEEAMAVIGIGGITLFRGNNVTVSPNPVNLLAAAGSRSRVSITVFDPFGKPVPAGMRIGITAEPVYYLNSRGGSFVGGAPATDSRFTIYTTITGGIVEVDYAPPVLAANQTGFAILQVVEVDDAGHVLGPGPMGIGVINLSGLSGQTAPQPIVLAASPVQGQSGVGLNAPIVVAFSQSLDPVSVTATTFSVSSGAPVLGTRTLSAGVGGPNSVVTFVPNGALAPNSVINVLVGSGIKSASGSPLLSGQSFAFSTGLEADTTAPSVELVNPANGATGVGTNAVVMVQFSENVNAASVTTETLTLSAGGVLVPGRVSVGSRVGDAATPSLIATFTPDQLLSANITYTVQLNSAITDTAGNPLVPFTAGFITASGIDNFQPSVSTINPANSSVDVPSDIAIAVTFSEPMNPETINEMTFSFSGPSVVKAAYSFSNGNTVATLTPLQPLLAGGQYTITLTTLIRDVAGNPLPGNVTSRFTTALAPGTANLPTTATVTVNPGSLFANGQIATTVTISNISRNGVLVPNGTLIAVTAEPVFNPNSVGGVISGGSVGSSADPRFLLFSTFGAEVTVSYTPPDLTGKGIGNVGVGSIQVASVDLDHRPVSLIGSGAASLFGIGSATVVAGPTSILADGISTSTLTVTVKNPQGNLVPDGTRVALTAAKIFSQTSAGGNIIEGMASVADSRVKIFTTAGGQVTATYRAPVDTGTAIIQAMTINGAGLPTALLAAASITLTAPPVEPPLMVSSCRGPSSGMIGCWQGEGNANDSIGARHGTLQGGAAFAAGRIGQAFSFDGVDDYIDLGSSAAFDVADFTVEAWVYVDPTTNSGERRIVSRDDVLTEGLDGRELYNLKSSSPSACAGSDGKASFQIMKGGVVDSICAPPTLAAGFHHFAGVRSGTMLLLYVDGTLAASKTTSITGLISPEAALAVGQVSPTFNAEFFNGLIDEVKLYNRALTSQEVQGIVACYGPASALVSCWQGDGSVNDAVGANHGTLQNGATFAGGKIGQAFNLDGVDDYVLVPDEASLDITGSLTIEGWMKVNALKSFNMPIVWKGSSSGADVSSPYSFLVQNDGTLLGMIGNGSAANYVFGTSAVPIGTFFHAAFVITGAKLQLYINGELHAEAPQTITPYNSNFNLQIGAIAGNAPFSLNGRIDEIKIYNRALSAGELKEIATAACPGTASGLVSCWLADGNADDAVGTNHGTLQGGAFFAVGQFGQAFGFDGTNDYVGVPNNPNLNMTDALTVEAWINVTDIPVNFPAVLTKGPTNAQYLLFINAAAGAASGTASVCFRINIGPSNPTSSSQLNLQTICSTSKVTFGQFIHVAGVFDGSSIKIYVNKALEGSTPVSGSIASDTRPLTIGAGDGVLFGSGLGNQFHGKVDEVKIFNSALSYP